MRDAIDSQAMSDAPEREDMEADHRGIGKATPNERKTSISKRMP
jgi:hypothetical protein